MNEGTQRGFREKTCGARPGLSLGGEESLNTPLGRTMRYGSLNGRQDPSGILVGIHDALADVEANVRFQGS